MRTRLSTVLRQASAARCAIAACNVYTLDQAAGVVDAAEAAHSPVVLQVHPDGAGDGLWPLVAGLRILADDSAVPVAVHLDHCADGAVIRRGIASGLDGVMADGSRLEFEANARFVRELAAEAHAAGLDVEAELGRLAGGEDGWTVEARVARLTSPDTVAGFVAATGADLLAVSIGNVHGSTPVPPTLDLERLRAIRDVTDVPLVLHGGSGVDDDQLQAAIALGICKVNVNTELRAAYRDALLGDGQPGELVDILARARQAVTVATAQIIERLGSHGLLDLPHPGGE